MRERESEMRAIERERKRDVWWVGLGVKGVT